MPLLACHRRGPLQSCARTRARATHTHTHTHTRRACLPPPQVDTYDYVVYKADTPRPRSAGNNAVREYSITVKNLKPGG